MAVAMILSMAMPAIADDHTNHTITINENNSGHTYVAYQIFAGAVETGNNSDPVLSNIKWGSGIDWDAERGGLNFIQALQSINKNPDYHTLYASVATTAGDETAANIIAGAVADVLEKTPRPEHGLAFAKVANEYLTSVQGTSTYSNGKHTITGLADGYYLVKEINTQNLVGTTATAYLMTLVDDAEVTPKIGTVSIEHKVLDAAKNRYNVADHNIADSVRFEVTSRVPDMFHLYDTFAMDFVIDLGEYFEYDSSNAVAVTITSGSNTTDLADDKFTIDAPSGDDNILTVSISNLKDLGTTVLADYYVEVEYSAKLRDTEVLGNGTAADKGNVVTAHIEYTSAPYSTEKAKTVDAKAAVFTYQLKLFKKDGKQSGNVGLAGAEFILYRGEGNSIMYLVGDIDEGSEETTVTVTGWDANKENATSVTSPASGYIVFKGLDALVYHLEEIEAPEQYDAITTAMRFNISAALDDANYEVDALSVTAPGGIVEDGDIATGEVAVTVVNNPGNTLPSTGGMGTTLFYVIGSILVMGALVMLITKKRMAAEN